MADDDESVWNDPAFESDNTGSGSASSSSSSYSVSRPSLPTTADRSGSRDGQAEPSSFSGAFERKDEAEVAPEEDRAHIGGKRKRPGHEKTRTRKRVGHPSTHTDNDQAHEDDGGENEEDERRKRARHGRNRPRKRDRSSSTSVNSEEAHDDDGDEDEGETEEVDVESLRFGTDDLRAEWIEAAKETLDSSAVGSTCGYRREPLDNDAWNWEANCTDSTFCFACKYASAMVGHKVNADDFRQMQHIFNENYQAGIPDISTCGLVQDYYIKHLQSSVPGRPLWSLESIMRHYFKASVSRVVGEAFNDRTKHLLRWHLVKQMTLVPKRQPTEKKLDDTAVKLYLALDKITSRKK